MDKVGLLWCSGEQALQGEVTLHIAGDVTCARSHLFHWCVDICCSKHQLHNLEEKTDSLDSSICCPSLCRKSRVGDHIPGADWSTLCCLVSWAGLRTGLLSPVARFQMSLVRTLPMARGRHGVCGSQCRHGHAHW